MITFLGASEAGLVVTSLNPVATAGDHLFFKPWFRMVHGGVVVMIKF